MVRVAKVFDLPGWSLAPVARLWAEQFLDESRPVWGQAAAALVVAPGAEHAAHAPVDHRPRKRSSCCGEALTVEGWCMYCTTVPDAVHPYSCAVPTSNAHAVAVEAVADALRHLDHPNATAEEAASCAVWALLEQPEVLARLAAETVGGGQG